MYIILMLLYQLRTIFSRLLDRSLLFLLTPIRAGISKIKRNISPLLPTMMGKGHCLIASYRRSPYTTFDLFPIVNNKPSSTYAYARVKCVFFYSLLFQNRAAPNPRYFYHLLRFIRLFVFLEDLFNPDQLLAPIFNSSAAVCVSFVFFYATFGVEKNVCLRLIWYYRNLLPHLLFTWTHERSLLRIQGFTPFKRNIGSQHLLSKCFKFKPLVQFFIRGNKIYQNDITVCN